MAQSIFDNISGFDRKDAKIALLLMQSIAVSSIVDGQTSVHSLNLKIAQNGSPSARR